MSNTEQQVRHQTVMDDEARYVARVYAEALYSAAEKNGQIDAVLDEFESLVNGVFAEDPGLELVFSSASISRERKQGILDRAFQDRASPVFVNFLRVLNNHERLDMLRPISQGFRALYDRRNRRIPVHATSAVPMTDDERRRLCDDLRTVAGMEPILHESVDPNILGGLIVRVRDWVYDASVRSRLEQVKNQLIDRSSHGIQSGRDRFGN